MMLILYKYKLYVKTEPILKTKDVPTHIRHKVCTCVCVWKPLRIFEPLDRTKRNFDKLRLPEILNWFG